VVRNKKKEVIKAIHFKEVQNFLELLESKETLKEKIVCNICKEKITEQNFKAAIYLSGAFLFCCTKPKCYDLFIENIRT